MDKFKPCKISDVIQGKFSIGGSSGDASYIYVNGASATSRLVKDAIEHAVNSHDQLVDTITEQEKVISELYKQLEHCHSWLKIHADYHGSPLCINTDKILYKHKQSKGE